MPLWITPAVLRWIAWVGLAVAIFGAGWHFGGIGPERDLAELRGAMATESAEAEARARKLERDWAAHSAAVGSDYEAKRQSLSDDLAAARGESDRLRRAIADYASRTAAPAGAACPVDDRAEALGALLAELERLASDSAAAADAEGERLRALQAWLRATE